MVRVVFVCWGNICRSPMAERVARHHLEQAGIHGVELSSAATSREELGEPIDPRAARTLRNAGYDADGHVAHQITPSELEAADLVVGMETIHLDRMRRIAGRPLTNAVLFSTFDPQADEGDGVPDPWYGGQTGFDEVLDTLLRGMPAFAQRCRELLEDREHSDGDRSSSRSSDAGLGV